MNMGYDIPAGTTTRSTKPKTFEEHIAEIKEEFEEWDFGLKLKGKNIFYFLYLKDKLSYRKGLMIMIGHKTILNWDNCK